MKKETAVEYRCTGCGSASVEINRAHPTLDDRYRIGHCVRCTPWPKPKDNPLIRSDLWNQEDFDHRRRVAEAKRLVAKLQSKAGKMGEEEIKAAKAAVEFLTRVA